MQKPKRARLNIAQINPHYDLQPRMAIDQSVVEEYRGAIERGDQMPAVTVFFDRVYYYLVDGFHRLDAAKLAGRCEIDADVIDGDFRAAKLYSLGVNSAHGLKRSSADKRKACLEMLSDTEWAAWSNVAIAKHLKVDDKTVAKYREEAAEDYPRNSEDAPEILAASITGDRPRTVQRNGTVYEQKTANLGPQPKASEPQSPSEHETTAELAARNDATAIKPASFPHNDKHSSTAPDVRKVSPTSIELAIRDRDSAINARNEALDLVEDLRSTAAELQAEVEAYRAAEVGDGEKELIAAKKRILKLEAEVHRIESIRDDWMNKHREAIAEVKKLRRQLERGHA